MLGIRNISKIIMIEENNSTTENNIEKEDAVIDEAMDIQLAQARYYKTMGGKIAVLFEKYPETSIFFADNYVSKRKLKRMNSKEFLKSLKEKFPNINDEEFPSDSGLRQWRVKYFEAVKTGDGNLVLAMKDEVKIISVMQNFNFFEQRMRLHNKAKKALEMAEKVLERAYELSVKMNVPTSAFTASIADFFKALEARGVQLDKLDELAIRFGFMPPRGEKNLAMNTQINNYTLSDDNKKLTEELGLSTEDFTDVNMPKTYAKIINHYAGQSGKSIFGTSQQIEPGNTEPAEVVDSVEEGQRDN